MFRICFIDQPFTIFHFQQVKLSELPLSLKDTKGEFREVWDDQ